MNLILKNIVITFAVITGFLMLLVGIKSINFKENRKYGLFYLTLLIVLNLTNCVNSQSINSNSKYEIEASDDIKDIIKTTEWQNFKNLWTIIDSIEPQKQVSNYNNQEYITYQYLLLDDEQLKKVEILQSEFANSISELISKTDLTSSQAEILNIFTDYRLTSIKGEHLYTRMITTDYIITETIVDFEFKIDTLNNFKNKNIFSESEYIQAIENLYSIVDKSVILAVIEKNYGYIYNPIKINSDSLELLELGLKEFENLHASVLNQNKEENDSIKNRLNENYSNTCAKIEQLKIDLPVIHNLLIDLENY